MKFKTLVASLCLISAGYLHANDSTANVSLKTNVASVTDINSKILEELKKYKIEKLITFEDSYTLYKKHNVTIEAKQKTEIIPNTYLPILDKSKEGIRDPLINFNLGDIYSASSILKAYDVNGRTLFKQLNKEKWQSLSSLKLNGKVIIDSVDSSNIDFQQVNTMLSNSGDLAKRQFLNKFLTNNQTSLSFRQAVDADLIRNLNEDSISGEITIGNDVAKVGGELGLSTKQEKKTYNLVIETPIVDIDYQLDPINDPTVLKDINPKDAPVYVSKVRHGVFANLSIQTVLNRKELESALNGKYDAVELKSKYKNVKEFSKVTYKFRTLGVNTSSIQGLDTPVTGTSDLSDLQAIVQSFQGRLNAGIEKAMEKGAFTGVPYEVEFRYVVDNTPFNASEYLRDKSLDYDYKLKAKEVVPFVERVEGLNVKSGLWSDDVIAYVDVLYNHKYDLIKSEFKKIADLNIKPEGSDLIYKIPFSKVGKHYLDNHIESLEEKSELFNLYALEQSEDKLNPYPISDFTNRVYQQDKRVAEALGSEKKLDRLAYLFYVPLLVLGDFADIQIKAGIRCTNALSPCATYDKFTYQKMDLKKTQIFKNNQVKVDIKWVEKKW